MAIAVSVPTRASARWRVRSLTFGIESVILFAGGLLLNLLTIAWLWRTDVAFGDAVSRTSQAYFVLFSRDPHLGAIGFIWNPLPALVQLPLVALLEALRLPVVLAGPLLTALFGALTLVVLDRILRLGGLPNLPRRISLAGFALNPMVLLYNGNGMSESLFFLLMLLAVLFFWRWHESRETGDLVWLAVAGAALVQVRYESIALVAALVLGVVIADWRGGWRLGRSFDEARAQALVVALPATFSFGVWVFLNWTIMGNPLYFLVSPYGNVGHIEAMRSAGGLEGAGSLLGALIFTAERSLWLSLLFPIAVLAVAALGLLRRNGFLIAMIGITLSQPAFYTLMTYNGSLFPWLRYAMYALPLTLVLMAVLWKELPRLRSIGVRPIGIATLVFTMLATSVLSAAAMDAPQLGREERSVTCRVVYPERRTSSYGLEHWNTLSDYLEIVIPAGRVVLLDALMGYPLPLLSGNIEYLITSDFDFDPALRDPAAYVDYILVPAPVGAAVNDRLIQAFPDIWEQGSNDFELVARFSNDSDGTDDLWGWALYAVGSEGRAQAGYLGDIPILATDQCSDGSGFGLRVMDLLGR